MFPLFFPFCSLRTACRRRETSHRAQGRSGTRAAGVARLGAGGPGRMERIVHRHQFNAAHFSVLGHLFGLLDLEDGT